MEEKKIGKVYEIYSPSLDLYYIGSTFLKMNIRKNQHKVHYKRAKNGLAKTFTAHRVIDGNDAEYRILEMHENIEKVDLLKKETQCIKNKIELLGGKVVNHGKGLCQDILAYQKEYRIKHKDYFKNYNRDHKNEINDNRKRKYVIDKRLKIIEKLNEKKYKKIPIKVMIKYNIVWNHQLYCYV